MPALTWVLTFMWITSFHNTAFLAALGQQCLQRMALGHHDVQESGTRYPEAMATDSMKPLSADTPLEIERIWLDDSGSGVPNRDLWTALLLVVDVLEALGG